MCERHAQAAEPQLVDVGKLDRRALIAGLSSGTLLLASGCATNPVTGRSQLMFVDDSALARMALDAWAEQKRETPVSRDPALNARLQRVGQKIYAVSGIQNAQPEFVVFDTPEKNAFVLPGVKVGFYRGLMEIADKDDHIATVMGHELAHVTGRHAAERFSQSTAAQLGMVVGAAVIGSQIGNSGTQQVAYAALGLGVQVGLLMPYSRLQESEADRVGIDYMHASGYDVRESLVFWDRMNRQGGRRPPELLSTHPDPVNRMAALRAYINNRGYAVV